MAKNSIILNVAEKPSVAKGIAQILSQGQTMKYVYNMLTISLNPNPNTILFINLILVLREKM